MKFAAVFHLILNLEILVLSQNDVREGPIENLLLKCSKLR